MSIGDSGNVSIIDSCNMSIVDSCDVSILDSLYSVSYMISYIYDHHLVFDMDKITVVKELRSKMFRQFPVQVT